jgi:hypothetical protein
MAVTEVFDMDDRTLIRDQQLIEALDFIKIIGDEHDLSEDFHSGNIMWRPTQFGPQLVITDPLFWGE